MIEACYRSAIRTSSIIALVALLTGCGGANAIQSASRVPGIDAQSTLAAKVRLAKVSVPHGKPWMESNANQNRLLYVSDPQDNIVQVYNYPKGSSAGTIFGFNQPQGECVDNHSNIYITNSQSSNILEYGHGRTQPKAVLSDPGEFPVGCAVNPLTGDLAVSNIVDTNGGPGSVSIFHNGQTKNYGDSNFNDLLFCGYDAAGNLFVDGTNKTSGGFLLAELPAGHSKFTILTLKGATITFGAGVQFDGKYLAVGDQDGPDGNSVIYRVSVTGTTATVVGTTTLEGSKDVIQFFITRGKTGVVAPDGDLATADTFTYPGGTLESNKKIYVGGLPLGAAISLGR